MLSGQGVWWQEEKDGHEEGEKGSRKSLKLHLGKVNTKSAQLRKSFGGGSRKRIE